MKNDFLKIEKVVFLYEKICYLIFAIFFNKNSNLDII